MPHRVAIGPSSFAAEDQTPLKLLEEGGVTVVPNPFGRRLTEEEIIEHLKDIDGLIAGLEPLNERVLKASPQLKVIARVGIGMNNVDSDAASRLGVKVSNTPDGPIQAVAEMTIAALLTLCRQILPANAALHEGEWKKTIGRGLAGAKVLLVGYGRIGRRVGEVLRALGSELIVFDPFIEKESLTSGEVLVPTLAEGLALAKIVSLHSSGTELLIDAAAFEAMSEGTILLNSARGELVDEPALTKALDSGKIAGAWFDAFIEEPYSGPLTQYDQVILTPHMSTYSRECRLGMESAAVENLLRDLGTGG